MADEQTATANQEQDQSEVAPELVQGSFKPLPSAAAAVAAPAPTPSQTSPELMPGTFRPLANLHPNVEKQLNEEDEGWLHKMFLGDETAAGTKLPEGFYDVHPSSQFHVIQGSPLEKMIKFFDPTFQGGVTKEQHGINESKDALNLPLANVSQFIDKDQHPIGKAVAEAAQSLTSPGNLALMASTGGMGMISSAKSLGMINRLVSAGFSGMSIAQAYKHFGDFKDAFDKGDANEAMYQLTHLLLSGAMATAAGEHFVTGEAPAPATRIGELAGKAVKSAAGGAAGAIKSFGFGQSLEDLVTKASPPSKGKASRYQENVRGALPQLKEIFRANPDVSTPQEMTEAIQKHIDTIEDGLRDEARKMQTPEGEPAEKSLMLGLEDDVSKALDDYFKEHAGAYKQPVIDAAKAEVIDRLRQGSEDEPRSPSLFEAENLRRQWGKETAPAFGSDTSIPNAARDAKIVANSVVRDKIDEKYVDLGVKGVGEWRRQEAPLIEVKDQLLQAFKKSQDMGEWNLVSAATRSMGWGLLGSLFGHVPGGLAGETLGIAKDYIRDRLTNPNRLIQRAADKAARGEEPTGAALPKEIPPTEPLPKYPGAEGRVGYDFNRILSEKTKSGEHFEGNAYTDEGIRKTFDVPKNVSLKSLEGQGFISYQPKTGTWEVNEPQALVRKVLANPKKGAAEASTAPEQYIHYSNQPIEGGIISGARRGEAKAGEEAARLQHGNAPQGVYAYREGAQPESQIKSRPYKATIAGEKKIADIGGRERELFQSAYQEAYDKHIEAGENNTVALQKAINDAEGALRDAGFHGYENAARRPGHVFLFGDQSVIKPGKLSLPENSKWVAATPDEYKKELEKNPQSATLAKPSLKELRDYKIFKLQTPEGKDTGIAYTISPENEAGGFINNGPYAGATKRMMEHAPGQGAKWASAWDVKGFLPDLYEKHGMEKTGSVSYDAEKYGGPSEELKEAWRKSGWKDGDPYPSVWYGKFPEAEKPVMKARAAVKGSTTELLKKPIPKLEPKDEGNLFAKDLVDRLHKGLSIEGSRLTDFQKTMGEWVRATAGKISKPSAQLQRAINMAHDELTHWIMENGGQGKGWYRRMTDEAMNVMKQVHPSLEDDPARQGIFKALWTAHSYGNDPLQNMREASQNFSNYEKNGKFEYDKGVTDPDTGKNLKWSGHSGNVFTIAKTQHVIDKLGEEGAIKWLTTKHPWNEIVDMFKDGDLNVKKTGITLDKNGEAYGAHAFGPKGGAFFLNLNGINDHTTVDIWGTRALRRWEGRSGDPDTLKIDKETGAAEDTAPTQDEIDRYHNITMAVAKKLKLDPDDVQALQWYYEHKLYEVHGVGDPARDYTEAARNVANEPGPERNKINALDFINALKNLPTRGNAAEGEVAAGRGANAETRGLFEGNAGGFERTPEGPVKKFVSPHPEYDVSPPGSPARKMIDEFDAKGDVASLQKVVETAKTVGDLQDEKYATEALKRIQGRKSAPATRPLLSHLEDESTYDGDVRSDIHHEMGHIVNAFYSGLLAKDGIWSERHPELSGSGVAGVDFDYRSIGADENGYIDSAQLIPHIDSMLTMLMGGGAADQVMSGIPIGENTSTGSDLSAAMRNLARIGFTGEEAADMIEAAQTRAINNLTDPEIQDIMRKYSEKREEGLPITHHMSQERVEEMYKEIQDVENKRQSAEGGVAVGNRPGGIGVGRGVSGEAIPEPEKLAAKSVVRKDNRENVPSRNKLIAAGATAAGLGALGALTAPKTTPPSREKEEPNVPPQMMEGTFRPLPVPEPEPQVESAEPIEGDIPSALDKAATDFDIPLPMLKRQARQESGLDPTAISPKGAIGIMQLMPGTARDLNVDPYDPEQNIRGGASYMAQLHKQFGSWDKTLAAYNWGPEKVARAVELYGDDWLDYTPQETQNYVKSILHRQR